MSDNNIYIHSVNQYKWRDNKVIEFSNIFEAISYTKEVNNYHNSLTKTHRWLKL